MNADIKKQREITSYQYILIFIIVFSLFAFAKESFAYGNYQILEITNIKTVETGNPAISQYNRIFRAYPGITYSVPVGVIGGAFPYVFSLSDAPSGMTIDNHTGVITWTNPQTNATPTVTVHDKDGDSVTATWTITVTSSTNDFIFVNDDYSGTETGSISQPYNSIQDVLDLGSSAVNRIVYFRGGTYAVPVSNSTYTGGATGCGLTNDGGRAHIWIGYPEETVIFNMWGVNNAYATWFEAIDLPADNIWFENITLQSPRRAGWWINRADYFTFYNCTINDLTWIDSGGNPGGVKIMNPDVYSYYPYVVDSKFNDFVTAHGVGSLYGTNRMLIERNIIDGQTADPSAGYTLTAIAIKASNQYITVRQNQVYNYTRAIAESLNAVFNNCAYNEICYNYFATQTGGFNRDETQGTTWIYRNTIGGNTTFEKIGEGSCEGPWHVENNVLQNSATSTNGITYYYNCGTNPSSCVSQNQNLTGASGLIDASGLLINRSNVGTYGWEIAEDEYWSEGGGDVTAPSTPSGLSVS